MHPRASTGTFVGRLLPWPVHCSMLCRTWPLAIRNFEGSDHLLRDDGRFGSVMTRPHALVSNYPIDPLVVGSSPAMEDAVSVATRVAMSNVKVLITGESGVGKDVFARLVHGRSARSAERFVALNCAGVAETLLESELF